MGESKAFLDFDGEPLLSRVVGRVAALARDVVVVAQEDQPLPPCGGARIVRDGVPDSGPLVGLVAGLEAIDPASPWAFVCTTDAPWIHGAVVMRLAERGEGFDAAVASVDDKPHVLTAVYRPYALAEARALVSRGERRASLLSERLLTRYITRVELLADEAVRLGDPELLTFENLNTPEDILRARRRRS